MLTVISPAKTLDFETPVQTKKFSEPSFLSQSKQLVTILKKKSPAELSKLMSISPKLAELNVDRYKTWKPPFTEGNAKQAVLAFKGDVYLGLEAETYSQRDLNFAQNHLRILSGLYGVLKPLDLIQAYRLEMGTKLENKRGQDLYEFWGNRITKALNEELSSQRSKVLVNLASNEYFKSVQPKGLKADLITPVFKDYNKGSYKVLSFFAKRARGSMATYIVRNRIDKAEDIKSFDVDGYKFNDSFSSDTEWVFTRKAD